MTAQKTWIAGEQVTASDLNNNFDLAEISSQLAGENIIAGDSVYLSEGNEFEHIQLNDDGSTASTSSTSWLASFFTTPSNATLLQKVIINLNRNNSGSTQHTLTLSIRAISGGLPTGPDLATATYTTRGDSQNSEAGIFDFANFSLSTSTQYALIIRDPSDTLTVDRSATAGAVTVNSGSTWSSNGTSFAYRLKLGLGRTVGRVYKTDATKYDERITPFGIAFATATAGNVVAVKFKRGSVITGLSGLTAGTKYYLSDTSGALSSTPSTTSPRFVGVAISSTSLHFTPDYETFIPITGQYYYSIAGGDPGAIARDVCLPYTPVQTGNTGATTRMLPSAKKVVLSLNTAAGPLYVYLKKPSESTYIQSSNFGNSFMNITLDLEEGRIDQQCSGFVSHGRLHFIGYYI